MFSFFETRALWRAYAVALGVVVHGCSHILNLTNISQYRQVSVNISKYRSILAATGQYQQVSVQGRKLELLTIRAREQGENARQRQILLAHGENLN